MRSHAKASTAGSNKRQASSLGSIFRGADATRGSSPRANGSGAPKAGRLVIPVGVFVAIVATMALVVSPASATKTHLFEETFGSAAQPSFTSARGIAIDQSSGDVLVMDAGSPPSIKRYNADGSADSFPATGTNAIDGAGAGDETPQNGLGFASASESQIAVDNSGTATDGNIYVTQGSPNAINVFSDEGAYLGQLTAAGATPFSEACGVAVDSAGAVYVGDFGDGIHRFAPAANPPVNADHTATFTSVTQPCTLAAGAGASAGFLFAATFSSTVKKIDSATGELKYTVSADNTTTVSVDPATGRLYSASGSSFKEFDASGAGSATAISSVSLANQAQGVAVRGSSGDVYVSRAGNANVEVFGPTVTVPNVTTGSATAIEATTATLNGTVNPDGVELSECRFEYGKTTSYGSSVPCAQSPATIGSGTSNVAVSANLSGLELGAEYHFRLIATNPNGAVNGADEAFKLKSPPVLKSVWAAGVVLTEATLKARINPEGFATTYEFEWGTDSSYGNSTPVGAVGSDKADHTVGSFLEGLTPGTTYHYRVLATNSIGTSEGPDRTFTTYEPVALNTECPNQAFRAGPSATLPDCRAYEMVSPVDKNGGDAALIGVSVGAASTSGWYDQSSPDGLGLTYGSTATFANSGDGLGIKQYIATRNADGWSTDGIAPPFTTGISFVDSLALGNAYQGFSEDLSKSWLLSISRVPLVPGPEKGYALLYSRDNTTGSYELLTNTELFGPSEAFESNKLFLQFTGASADETAATFRSRTALTADSVANTSPKVYVFADGAVHLVSVLPDGTADPQHAEVGTNRAALQGFKDIVRGDKTGSHVISDDGSRIFWTSAPDTFTANATIYVRLNPAEEQSALSGGECTEPAKACTVQVSPGNGSRFMTATPDGSKALIQTSGNLEVVDVDSGATTTVAGPLPEFTDTSGDAYGLLGASEDLSRIYFVSEEDLAPGATAGEFNLYLDHEGAKTFIATLSALDVGGDAVQTMPPAVTGGTPLLRSSRVTPDGRHIAFTSTESLTGYDNTDAIGNPNYVNEGDLEVYVYDADSDRLDCASCNPSGARPVGDALRRPFSGTFDFHNFGSGVEVAAAAWLTTSPTGIHTPNALSDDGDRVFFEAFDALLPADTNGAQDVYQWEAPGSGDCTEGSSSYSPLNGGCISLISTGTSPGKSEFVDASSDGSSIFFRTSSSIDPRDASAIDIYVAREGGGFAPPPAPVGCEGDACQDAPAAPDDPSPASATFRGAGDPLAPRDCSSTARRAAKLSRQAKRLQGAAERSSSPARSQQLRRRSARLAKQAKKLGKSAKRCRSANRGAGR